MILSDRMIREAMLAKEIVIEPFDLAALGTNSYDVHLGSTLMTYRGVHHPNQRTMMLDCMTDNDGTFSHQIGPKGFILEPGKLYLASTVEYTETHKHVPFLDGKSSVGRLGIFVHCTAGRGDVFFCGHWTLEIVVVQPVRVYAGMPIGQLIYFETGEVDVNYRDKPGAKYRDGRNPDPQPSRMFMNFVNSKNET